jgi:hypothetical protein
MQLTKVYLLKRYLNLLPTILNLKNMAYCYIKRCLTGITLLLLLLAKTSYAAVQQDTTAVAPARPGQASGIVLDEYGNPLQGVKVTNKGKNSTQTTGKDGAFAIAATKGDALVFTAANYNAREVAVKDTATKLTVRLLGYLYKGNPKPSMRFMRPSAHQKMWARYQPSTPTSLPPRLQLYIPTPYPGNSPAYTPSSTAVLPPRKPVCKL